jgi:hypothetical protein
MTKQTHFKQTHLKKAGHKLRVGTLAVTASFAFTIPMGIAAELPHPSPEDARVPSSTATADRPAETTLGTPEGAAAVRVYRDPQTGKFEVPTGHPSAEELESLGRAFSTSSQGLVEVPSPVQGGGVKVDLRGRFRNPQVATQGPDGRYDIQHQPQMPSSAENQ